VLDIHLPGVLPALVEDDPAHETDRRSQVERAPGEVLEEQRMLALDLDPARLALAERTGAIPVDVATRNAQTAVSEHTDGRGADVVIEAVGTPAAFERSLDIVRRGGTVVVMGVYTSELVQAQIGVWWIRALQLRFAGTTPVQTWWERAMAEVQAGRLDPLPIVSHRLPLEEAPKGYELFDTKQATKVLLEP
jgi:threonine dehydrogenase-like Zn-dependent dehydrogenase